MEISPSFGAVYKLEGSKKNDSVARGKAILQADLQRYEDDPLGPITFMTDKGVSSPVLIGRYTVEGGDEYAFTKADLLEIASKYFKGIKVNGMAKICQFALKDPTTVPLRSNIASFITIFGKHFGAARNPVRDQFYEQYMVERTGKIDDTLTIG